MSYADSGLAQKAQTAQEEESGLNQEHVYNVSSMLLSSACFLASDLSLPDLYSTSQECWRFFSTSLLSTVVQG
jgi:hypothetical protein